MQEWFVFGILSLLALASGTLWAQRRLPPEVVGLFVVGIVLRIAGSTARLEVMEQIYSGVGDAKGYYEFGRAYAAQILDLEFDFVTGGEFGGDRRWGTQFVRTVTGFVVFFTAESFRAAFLVFSLFAFTGMVLCALAFSEAFGQRALAGHARWVWLWPSLCFWPSSIGKDALMLLAAGLAVYGYVGKQRRRNWILLFAGIALASAIRPHVGATLALCVLVAESLQPGSLLVPKRLGGLVVAGLVAVLSAQAGLTQLGIEEADLEGIQEHFEFRSRNTAQGGSKIAISSGPSAVPMAFVNILFRPFPWEAGGMALLSAAEMTAFWILVALRWRHARALARSWRANAYLRFSVPFVLAISLLYGLAFANLGIIARQRSIILPFLLTLLYRLPLPQTADARYRDEVWPAQPRVP